MAKFQYLSYFLDDNTPVYGGHTGIDIIKLNDISKGDTANTKRISFHNHSGTHIDFPNHFSDEGKIINDYPASFWQFKKVHVITYKAKSNEIIDEKLKNKGELKSLNIKNG